MGDGAVAAIAVAGVLVGLALVGIGVKSLENYHPWKQVKGLAATVWTGFVTVVLLLIFAGAVALIGNVLDYW